MVSSSQSPLISLLDVSYSVSFVVRGQRPRRGNDLGHHHIGRASEPAGRASKQARGASVEAAMLGGPQIKLSEP